MNKFLFQFDDALKLLFKGFLIALCIGVTLGIVYLKYSNNLSTAGTVEQFLGNEESIAEDDFDIKYKKSVSEVLMTTHNHIISFAFIFLLLGGVFYFNSIIKGKLKAFLIFEPFLSIIFSFGSIFLIRFVDSSFVYVTIISAIFMYVSFYVMIFICLYELFFKKKA